MQHPLCPPSVFVRGQLEDGATAVTIAGVEIAALCGRAIEIPRLVEDQAGIGKDSALVMFEKLYSTLSVQLPSAFWVSLKTVPALSAPP